jgi:energy-coupling factor transporter ATP-binding protein EcfA2
MNERLEQNGKLFETNFGELGLGVEFVKGYESPMGDTLLYNLKNISQYNKKYLSSLLEKIAIYHHASLQIIDTKEAHFGIFDNTDEARKVSLSQLLCNHREITIGLDNLGQPVKLDFEKIPHLLIAGTTGSGKSVLLHNLICNLMIWYGRNHTKTPQFIIVDPKGNELDKYRNVRNTTFIDNTQGAIHTLSLCCKEMDRRYHENDMSKNDMYIIIDELADLMLTSKFEVEESIVRIAQKGRACGIHLIVATQRPTIDVCSGLIKANMPYRIALKTASVRDSVVILDQKCAEELNVGEAYFKEGVNLTRLKVAYPENELIAKVIDINRG